MLLIALAGIVLSIISTTAGLVILIYKVNANTNVRVDAIYLDLGKRIEALRIETKDDRHNYVNQIDGVLVGLKEDIHEIDLKLAGLIATTAASAAFRNGSH